MCELVLPICVLLLAALLRPSQATSIHDDVKGPVHH